MRGNLIGRRLGREETRVETARLAHRGNPVGEVRQTIEGEGQVFLFEQRAERQGACVQPITERPVVGIGLRRAEVEQIALPVVGEQHASFFKTLAHGRDVERQSLSGHTKPLIGGAGIETAAATRVDRVEYVDPPARKHVRTADERRAWIAADHEDLDADRCITKQQNRRGRANCHCQTRGPPQ